MTKVEQDLGVKATYSRENADQKRIKSLQDQVVKLEKENEQLKLEKDVLIGEEESKKLKKAIEAREKERKVLLLFLI